MGLTGTMVHVVTNVSQKIDKTSQETTNGFTLAKSPPLYPDLACWKDKKKLSATREYLALRNIRTSTGASDKSSNACDTIIETPIADPAWPHASWVREEF